MADDGNVMKAIVFLIVFSALFSFMYAYSSAAFKSGDTPNSDDYIKRHFSPEEMASMTFWTNNSAHTGYIHSVTKSTNWGTYVNEPLFTGEPACDGTRFDFYHPTADQRVRVYPISGNTDFETDDINMVNADEGFLCYQQWGWWDKEWEWISFERVLLNLKTTDEGVKANVHIDLKGGMNIYFLFPVGTTSENAKAIMESGFGFEIAMAQSFIDETESASNAWNALTGLLTFSIDTGFWILDYLISVPIYACIAFIAFYIIKELIP